jgi:periplasmic protein TonB
MSTDRTLAGDPEAADLRQRYAARLPSITRSPAERLTVLAIIGLVHVVAIVAIWTRNLRFDTEPAPLTVSLIDSVVPLLPPAPPIAHINIVPPPVAIALPANIEIIEDAPTAITVQEVPLQPLPAAPMAISAVTEAQFDVDYLNNPKPAYPPVSRRLREQGVVVLKVNVRADGSVANALIEKHSGSVRLDDAALAAVRRWNFVPARRGHEPIESWVLVPIEFELRS